jgi:quercetin dioxygenase-like cupin family protein
MRIEVNTSTNGDALFVVGDRIRFLGGLPGSDLELVEVDVPSGSGTPPHSHTSAELFYVVAGNLTVRTFSDAGQPPAVAVAGPGDAITIASGVPHNYVNESAKPVKMLVLLERSMVAFFRDVGTSDRQTEPDFAKLGAAMEKHGIDMRSMAA